MTTQEFIVQRAFRVAHQATRSPFKWRDAAIGWLKLALRWAEKHGHGGEAADIKNRLQSLGA